MKKMMTLVLAGILCMGALTGCGKSAEEKAVESFAQVMQQEMQAEMARAEENHAARQQEALTREQIAAKYKEPMDTLRTQYSESKDPAEIQRLAQEYNRLYKEMICDYAVLSGAAENTFARATAYCSNVRAIPLYDTQTRMAYYGFAFPEKTDKRMVLYHNSADSTPGLRAEDYVPYAYNSVLCVEDRDDRDNVTEFLLVKNGTDKMVIDLVQDGISGYVPLGYNALNSNYFSFTVLSGSDYLNYVYDISGTAPVRVNDPSIDTNPNHEYWVSSWSYVNDYGLTYVIK